MRIRNLDVGVEVISRLPEGYEVHLPEEKGLRPAFLPASRPLDEVLTRPSLDERLPRLLRPEFLETDLLEPAVLSDVRLQTRQFLNERAKGKSGSERQILEMAASHLEDTVNLDDEVRRSLAALLRG
jgi:Type III secretion system YscX (type_III_YscX)